MLKEELPLPGYLPLRGRRPLGALREPGRAALPPSRQPPALPSDTGLGGSSKGIFAAGKQIKCGSIEMKTLQKAGADASGIACEGLPRPLSDGRRKRFLENNAVAKRLFQFSAGVLGYKVSPFRVS